MKFYLKEVGDSIVVGGDGKIFVVSSLQEAIHEVIFPSIRRFIVGPSCGSVVVKVNQREIVSFPFCDWPSKQELFDNFTDRFVSAFPKSLPEKEFVVEVIVIEKEA